MTPSSQSAGTGTGFTAPSSWSIISSRFFMATRIWPSVASDEFFRLKNRLYIPIIYRMNPAIMRRMTPPIIRGMRLSSAIEILQRS
jgi:hypothetical protein